MCAPSPPGAARLMSSHACSCPAGRACVGLTHRSTGSRAVSVGTCALPEAAAGAVETAAVETWVCAHEPGLSRDLLALGSQLEVS